MDKKKTIETIIKQYNVDFKDLNVEIGVSELDGHKFMYEDLKSKTIPISYKRVYTNPMDTYEKSKQDWDKKFDMVFYGKK